MSTSTKQAHSSVNQLARKEIVEMVPYQSARRLFSSADAKQGQQKIWLNANEASGSGIYQLSGNSINRYPDFQPDNLLTAYSQYCGLGKTNILATRGADEGIELIIRTFCTAYQDSILICPPTYGMYAISAENHGAGIIEVPLIDEKTEVPKQRTNKILNIEALKAQVGKAKVVFLCSPGNPVGNLLPRAQIKQVIELFKDTAMVVVDEAYIEFCADQSVSAWLKETSNEKSTNENNDKSTDKSTNHNLIILRTLSKAFALAGLRCGFTLASTEVISLLSKVIAPYPISLPVAEMASNALQPTGLEQMNIRVQETTRLRGNFSQWLAKQPWCDKVFNTDANFILVCTPLKNEIFNGLKDQDILIRDQSKQPQLANCLRISIGCKQELELLKKVINNIPLNVITSDKQNSLTEDH